MQNNCTDVTFLSRDAMRKRSLCCGPVSVRPSVCLSVCHVMHSIQTAEDIIKLLYRSDGPIILVF